MCVYVIMFSHVNMCVQVFMHVVCVSANPNALLRYRKFPSLPRYPVGLMFASGAHVQHDAECISLFRLSKLITLTPPAHWKVDVAQSAVTTRQSNSLLLNADFKMLFS